jgi:methylenetetrahydrofolate/methylenetetrahydromethanopterin dehydrogenase (NADP+)
MRFNVGRIANPSYSLVGGGIANPAYDDLTLLWLDIRLVVRRIANRSHTDSAAMKPKILVQLDTDPQPSVFDGIVAVDAGVEHLFRHGGVTPANVRDLVYGALFTRGVPDLSATALFIGGSNVAAGEAVLEKVTKTFFGPFRVSVLFDANGANTTAAAAVMAALQSHGGSLEGVNTAVLAATGPVGQRVARLLCRLGATVAVGSRSQDRAAVLADTLRQTVGAAVTPFAASSEAELARALGDCGIIISAGTAGVTLLTASVWRDLAKLKALIDLNAVPPLGIEGIEATDKNAGREHVRAWGALGVGGTKMKIHKKAIQELFTSNDKILDAEQVLELGRALA